MRPLIMGRSKEEIIGRTDYDFFPREQADLLRSKDAAVLATGCESLNEEAITNSAGGLSTVVTRKTRYADPSGNRFLVGVSRDITERIRAEEALNDSEQRYQAIVQTAMDGFLLLDVQGRVMQANTTYSRMSGYGDPELLAMSIGDLDVLEQPAETAERIRKIVSRGEDRFESRHRRKDGTVFDVEVSVQYKPESGGYQVVFLRDITERRQASQEKAKLESQLRQV